MLLSHGHRFIYTKTLKTAGTSVEIYFEDACLPAGSDVVRGHHIAETVTASGVIGYRGPDPRGCTWYNHMPASGIRALVGQAVWDDYYKFCVIRNPFDKLVSFWWFAINHALHDPYKDADFSVIRADFSRWCVSHASDAVDRDKYLIEGRPAVDFFIRHETLLAGIEHVCSVVGLPYNPERLGRYKSAFRTSGRRFEEYFDRPAIAAAQAAFGWELDFFGYTISSDAECQARRPAAGCVG